MYKDDILALLFTKKMSRHTYIAPEEYICSVIHLFVYVKMSADMLGSNY
jgi:hypothetical protein